MNELPKQKPQAFQAYHPICVLTAKTEEAREVISIFEEQFQPAPLQRIGEQVFMVPGIPEPLTVCVNTSSGMGHMGAAVRVAQLVTLRQPTFLLFVGTAASLRPDKIQVGDVVIPRKAINRIYEKVSEKGQLDYENRIIRPDFKEVFFDGNALISDTATINCSADALTAVASMRISEIDLEDTGIGQFLIGEEQFTYRKCKVFDDIDIFSCGMVVDSVSYRKFLVDLTDNNMRKVGVIDMESYGFFSAIEAARNSNVGSACEGIMIRGISDYAGRKQQGEEKPQFWKEKSIRNAAIVAANLIQKLARSP